MRREILKRGLSCRLNHVHHFRRLLVALINGAEARNVFFPVGTSATLEAVVSSPAIILAYAAVTAVGGHRRRGTSSRFDGGGDDGHQQGDRAASLHRTSSGHDRLVGSGREWQRLARQQLAVLPNGAGYGNCRPGRQGFRVLESKQ
jgi:hypothetical protein